MTDFFRVVLAISVVAFPVASMLAVGLGFRLRDLAAPLRQPDRVFRAVVANFVLVPLLALAISRLTGLHPSFEAGMILVGTAAGAPFLLKLTAAADADVGLSAALLLLLIPLTVLFMPLVVPLVVADAAVDARAIAQPLLMTLLLPLAFGLALHSLVPRVAVRLGPIARVTSSVALVVLISLTIVLNGPAFRHLFGTGAILAAVLLTAGAFGTGFLISSNGYHRRTVMGLGAGQRNIAAALVVAARDFGDERTLIMVVLFSVVDLMVLFPIAWVLRRRYQAPIPPMREGHVAA